MAVHERHLAKKIVVWARRQATRQQCQAQAWCDGAYADTSEAVRDADCVAICAPVTVIPDLIEAIAPHVSPNTLVTDVGSTKENISKLGQAALPEGAHFVGSHPMAGSEKSGLEHASAQLFSGLPCLITPLPETAQQATQTIRSFWEQLGMSVHTLDPVSHDAAIAHVSHLPHLLAASLCQHLAQQDPKWTPYTGSGLRDTTRIAAGSPELWQGIVNENRQAILEAMEAFDHTWAELRTVLSDPESSNLLAFLQRAQAYRKTLE